MNKDPTTEQINELIKIYQSGDIDKAENISISISRDYPSHPFSFKILGLIYEKKRKYTDSIDANKKAILLSPNDPDLYNNIADVYNKIGKLNDAIEYYNTAIKIKKDYFLSYYNLGIIYQKTNNFNKAEENFNYVLNYKPDFIATYINLGLTLDKSKKYSEAEKIYKKGIKINNNIFELFFYLGNTLQVLGKIEEAVENYKIAIKLKPNFFGTYSNLANSFHKLGLFREAIQSYKKAIELNNNSPETFNNYGNLLRQLGNLIDSENNFKKAITLNPNFAKAYANLGNVYRMTGKIDESIEVYEKAINIEPELHSAEAHLIFQKKNVCDFTISEKILKKSSTLGITTKSIAPFSAISWNDNPEEQFLRSKKYVEENFNNKNFLMNHKFNYKNKKLKIGYFSADFYDFPSMHVMIGLLENHNKNLFEIYAFSFGPNNNDWMNKRVKSAVDHFIDVANLSTKEIIEKVHNLEIDIAIDENGYTFNARTELFQNRLSPIQINFMGFPSTSGADFIDYIIADKIVIPDIFRKFYSEKIIYLPHSFMPSDNMKEISCKNTTREEFNLPKDAFVLCCFNKTYKISLIEFDIWMRILNKIENSVLWLLESNEQAMQNLKQEVIKKGINPQRLIFAKKIPISEHLERHKHADLFVDTFNYNAHVTANDSLWAGLPVVTKEGKQFAARVSSSLLNSIDLKELITKNTDDYEKLILELATNKNKLSKIKENLSANKLKMKPLFNTELYTKNFENGLQKIFELYQNGEKPRDINVSTM